MNLTYNLISNLIDVIYFLETSGDEIINEDTAVSMIEQIAASLQENNSDDLKLLIKTILLIADCEKDRTKADFIKNTPEFLGLI